MSAPVSPVALESPTVPRISPIARLFVSFVSPGAVFEDIVRKPSVLFVLIALCLTAVLAQAIMLPKLDTESLLRKQFAKANVPEDKQEQIIAFTAKLKWLGPLATPIVVPISFAVLAGLYFLALKLLGSDQSDFIRVFSAVAHATWPPGIVHALLVSAVALTRSTIDPMAAAHLVKSNIGSFLPEGTYAPFVVFCDRLDIFQIWNVALVVLALKVAGRISTGKAVGIAAFFWTGMTAMAVAGSLMQTIAAGLR